MNRAIVVLYKFLWIVAICVLFSCNDNALIDTSSEINDRRWGYDKKVSYVVNVEDVSKPYNVYFNLRHTSDYKYSNIFILYHLVGPGMKPITQRKEFQLAYPDGEWLGSGSGNLFSYQLLLQENYRFPRPGKYYFKLEQNMRDNPLKEISDVGIRVAPAK